MTTIALVAARMRLTGVALMVTGLPALTFGQGSRSRDARHLGFSVSSAFQLWNFGEAITQDSLQVTGVTQWSVPVTLSAPLGARWTVDATTAVMRMP